MREQIPQHCLDSHFIEVVAPYCAPFLESLAVLLYMFSELFAAPVVGLAESVQRFDVREISYDLIRYALTGYIYRAGQLVLAFQLAFVYLSGVDIAILACPHRKLYVSFVAELELRLRNTVVLVRNDVSESELFLDRELERRRFQRLRKHCSGFALLKQCIVVEQIHYRRGESSGVLVERAFEGLLNRSVVQQAVEHLCRSSLCRGFLRLCLSRGGNNAVCVGRSGHDSFLSDILNIIALVSLRYSE